MINVKAEPRSTAMEFEFAYQARVAIDRIKFAIRYTEQFAPRSSEMQEVGLQLLDAVERLESAERSFQLQFRTVRRFGSHRNLDQSDAGKSLGSAEGPSI